MSHFDKAWVNVGEAYVHNNLNYNLKVRHFINDGAFFESLTYISQGIKKRSKAILRNVKKIYQWPQRSVDVTGAHSCFKKFNLITEMGTGC